MTLAFLCIAVTLGAMLPATSQQTPAGNPAAPDQFGEPWDWAGADLVSDWFRRNMRIYSNVVQLADSSSERLLVIYGAGHLGWLRHGFASNPNLRLRKLADFAR